MNNINNQHVVSEPTNGFIFGISHIIVWSRFIAINFCYPRTNCYKFLNIWSFLPQPDFDFPKYNPCCLSYKKRLKLKGGGLSRTTFTNDDESIFVGPPEFFIVLHKRRFLLTIDEFHLTLSFRKNFTLLLNYVICFT